jgi:hypothetical protein
LHVISGSELYCSSISTLPLPFGLMYSRTQDGREMRTCSANDVGMAGNVGMRIDVEGVGELRR